MTNEGERIKRLGNIGAALRALRHRNYRLFFLGQGISLIGTWMQSVAVAWLVFRLTRSEFMLGIVGFSSQIPAFLLSPIAGVLGDRINRHRILVAAQVLALLQALTIAAITILEVVHVWHVVALSALLGLINAFDMPTRQAFVIEMIDDKNDLGNAIALNSAIFNGSRLVGPAVAGVLIALWGEGVCFLVNGLSFIAVIAALVAMRVPERERVDHARRILDEMKEGFRYVLAFTPIRDLLMLISIISFISMAFPVVLPVFAVHVLGGGSHTYGFLVASTGCGALGGTLYLASRKSVVGLGRLILACLSISGVALLALGFSGSPVLAAALLAVVGFGLIVSIASCNTMIQTIVDEDKRGRVMSFYTMSFMGTAPLGSLFSGSVSSAIGVPPTIVIGGIMSLAGAAFFARRLPDIRRKVRPIYRRMGIIPEVAMGIQSATDIHEPE
ncbi:MAG: MFS transporter [Spirochaetes bacterium]|nr:MFS transporter [Spirochaetota bacterium]